MSQTTAPAGIDSPYAVRLAIVSMICVAAGGGSVYLPIVAMSQMADDFGGQRQVPSLAYMLGYFGMGGGGIVMGWLADRVGPRIPLFAGAICILLGAWLASSGSAPALFLGYGLMMGFLGNAATFTPLLTNVQGWVDKRRGTIVAIVSVGPAVGGFLWPQVYRALLPDLGWQRTLQVYGIVSALLVAGTALYVRRPPRVPDATGGRAAETIASLPLGSPALMTLLASAAFCCCLAMAMPFAHMVAFCGDLGISAARGSEAVSLILLSAIASTFAMGKLSDRIGPLRVSILCSAIQLVALLGFLVVGSIGGIYFLALLHGIPFIAIVQGYALNLRNLYGPGIGAWRLGLVMLFAMAGMAVGGWIGGVIYDATLSYRLAFQLALAANLINLGLLAALHVAQRRGPALA